MITEEEEAKMDPTIYIPRIIAQEGIDYLAEHGISVKVGTSIEEDVMCQEVRGCWSGRRRSPGG